MALHFDNGPDFGADKAAGEPCHHLTESFGCAIHNDRLSHGYSGCLRFDCQGAGQRVTQTLFAGVDWRAQPKVLPKYIEAFRAMRSVHQLYELVDLTRLLPLTPAQSAQRVQLLALLHPADDWTLDSLLQFEQGAVPSEVRAFLASLSQAAAALVPARAAP